MKGKGNRGGRSEGILMVSSYMVRIGGGMKTECLVL